MISFFNKNKWGTIAFILLVILNLATLTAFWIMKDRRMGMGQEPRSGVVEFLVKELGFDSIQKQKLMGLREEHQLKIQDLRKNNREAKNAFFDLLPQTEISDSTLLKASASSVRFDQESDILTFRHFQQIRNLCTDTQQKKFDSVIKQVLRMSAPPPPGRMEGPPHQLGDGPPPHREGGPPPPNNQRPPPPKD